MAKRTGTPDKKTERTPTVGGLLLLEADPAVLGDDTHASPEALRQAAERALEEYDYERAHHLLRHAAQRSSGGLPYVEALARFLVESYALYDEAATMLGAPGAELQRYPILRRLLADALVHVGRGADARALYEAIVKTPEANPDAALWARLATLREEEGDDLGAHAAYREALRRDPGASTLPERLAAVEARLATASAEKTKDACAAFLAGDPARARVLVAEVLAGPADPRDAVALLQEIDAHEHAALVTAAAHEARTADEAGDTTRALETWRRVRTLDPAHREARAAIERIERTLLCGAWAEHLARAAEAVADGRYDEAVRSFYRAQSARPADAVLPTEPVGRRLYDLTAELATDAGAQKVDRAAPGLAALCHAEIAMEAGREEEAEARLRDAAPTLSGFRRLESLRERLQDRARVRARARARQLYDDAVRHEASGDLRAALEGFQRVLAVPSADPLDAAERAARLEATFRREDEIRKLRERLHRLTEQEDWFVLRRELRNSGLASADPEFEELDGDAEMNIAVEYSSELQPPPFVSPDEWGRGLDSAALGLPNLDREGTRVLLAPDGDRLLVLSGPLLVVVDTERLTARLVAELSESLTVGLKGELALATTHPRDGIRVVIVSEREGHVLNLQVTDSDVSLEDRLDLAPLLGVHRDRTLRYYRLHGPSERLVQLETARGTAGTSRLRNLSLQDGRIVHDESYNYGIWNLLPYPGDDTFVVNRVQDFAQRLRPGYFTFGVIDHRGRLVRRVNLPLDDVPEPMERIHSIARAPSLGRLYLTYDYYDALGSVVRQHPALIVLKDDFEVFYQSPAPEKLLTGKRIPKGILRVVEPVGGEPLLVLPYTDPEGATGFTALGAGDLKPRFDLALEPGESLHSLHEAARGTRLLAVTFTSTAGAWRVRRVDPIAKGWSC